MSAGAAKMTGWQRRKARVRKKVVGTAERPRLNVYRSNKHIYAQVIDDTASRTIAAASTQSKELVAGAAKFKKAEVAKKVGALVGKLAVEKGVGSVVFDRSGYIYHGRVKELADGAREAGLKF